MEVVYYVARANLRRLMGLHPQWTQKQYAHEVGMSLGWVKKWKKRLQEAEPEDEGVLYSRSRARKHPPERISQPVVERIVAIAMSHQRACSGGRAPKPCSTTSPAIPICKASGCRAQAGRSMRSGTASRTHRASTAAVARAIGAARADEPLATRFQGCRHGARRSRWQAATCGGSPQCRR